MEPEHIGPIAMTAFILLLMITAYFSAKNDKDK